jgi:hypothetical protein
LETTYKYLVAGCDVVDKASLLRFREKRAEWLTLLRGGDIHSLVRQINKLTYRDILFRTINDLRQIGIESPVEGVGFNADVLNLLDTGFVSAQVMEIRRLTDRPKDKKKNGVFSLYRLIQDIEANIHLLTKENYVCHDGLPFDPDAELKHLPAHALTKGEATTAMFQPVEGPEAWSKSRIVHSSFDKLSGSNQLTRTRAELVDIQVLKRLRSSLSICDDIRKYADKFIAHAADEESRAGLLESQRGVTLDQFSKCTRIIYQVANFISSSVLWDFSILPTQVAQYEVLENLDKSWIRSDGMNAAREIWSKHLEDASRWMSEDFHP